MNEQVLYEKSDIYIHEEQTPSPSSSADKNQQHQAAQQAQQQKNEPVESQKIGGRLQIVKNKQTSTNSIRFVPYGLPDNAPLSATSQNDEWAFVVDNSVLTYTKESKDSDASCSFETNKKDPATSKLTKLATKLKMDINDLNSVRRIYPGHGIPSIIFKLNDQTFWPELHFYRGGSKEFLQELKKYFLFIKDSKDSRLWSVQRPDGQAFQKSLYELSLFEEQQNDVVKKFINQPFQSTLLGFSKVTNIFRDIVKPDEKQQQQQNDESSSTSSSSNSRESKFAALKSKIHNKKGAVMGRNNNHHHHDQLAEDEPKEAEELNELMAAMSAADNIHSTNNEGFEMVTKVDLGPMPLVSRGAQVGRPDFVLDDELGHIHSPDQLKEKIFRGGIEPELRPDLWKFMLNYYDWHSSKKSRTDKRKIRVDDYFRMKLQWKTISDEQKLKFSSMKERESLIEKDVQRTDRTNPYFEGDDNPNLGMMKELLMTYNMFNFDLGYVQGMSDLLAPIMVIMDNEVDSFWCFAGFMEKIESNFLMDQLHIKTQLSYLKDILEFVDPKFSSYLEKNESSNMYFCFRWILILFKREFEFPEIMRLWEVIWTELPCKNFHLLICIAILMMKRDVIIENGYGFNEILKYINDLSLKIDLNKTLEHAEGLYLQIRNFKNLPENICEIFGLPCSTQSKQQSEDFDDDRIQVPALSISPALQQNLLSKQQQHQSESSALIKEEESVTANNTSGESTNDTTDADEPTSILPIPRMEPIN